MIFASYLLIRPFPRTFGSEERQGHFYSMTNLEFLTTPRTNTDSSILQIGFTEQVKMKNCKHSQYNRFFYVDESLDQHEGDDEEFVY